MGVIDVWSGNGSQVRRALENIFMRNYDKHALKTSLE